MNPRIRSALTSLVVMALLVTACGGGDGGGTTLATQPEPTNSTVASTTTTVGVEPTDAPEIAGSYQVTHYASSSLNSITNIWPDSEITLVLASDGSLSGNAGCNNYTGTYEVSGPYEYETGLGVELGQALEMLDLSWTEMACEDLSIMEQESEYLEALQNVEYWFVGTGFGSDDEALLLRSLEGGLQVQASKG